MSRARRNPEPVTIALIGAIALGAWWLSRRKKSAEEDEFDRFALPEPPAPQFVPSESSVAVPASVTITAPAPTATVAPVAVLPLPSAVAPAAPGMQPVVVPMDGTAVDVVKLDESELAEAVDPENVLDPEAASVEPPVVRRQRAAARKLVKGHLILQRAKPRAFRLATARLKNGFLVRATRLADGVAVTFFVNRHGHVTSLKKEA
jgi:hypothetical protein